MTLAWDPNIEPDLAGYKIYYGTELPYTMLDVGNQTTATLTDLQPELTYTIYATAFNTAGLESDPSTPITYTVPAVAVPPSITTQPVGQSVNLGEPFTLSVEATGTAPLSYQWFKNGLAISGANSATLSLAALIVEDAGSYTVRISNGAGEVTSDPALLVVVVPLGPEITVQPLSQTLNPGEKLALSVQAAGTAPLAFQWLKNGSEITSATSATLSITSVNESDAGSYTVRISNTAGSVTSEPAVISVNSVPSITTQPLSQTVSPGQALTLSVEAIGTAPLTYQWFKDGSAIPNATSATFSIASVSESDAGSYRVSVSNAAGSVTSQPAEVLVNEPPAIAEHPVSQAVTAGTTVIFSVTATGAGPLEYQWFKDGISIPAENGASYTLASATLEAAGSYTVQVSNVAGSIESEAAILTVTAPPEIVTQPESQTVSVGRSATFSVAARGSDPLQYQWRKNGVIVPEATGSSFAIASVQTSDAGDYWVEISNLVGEVESQSANLSVVSSPKFVNRGNGKVKKGETVTMEVEAAGSEAFEYQWYRNGELLPGATVSTLELSSVDELDAGEYTVGVSNSAGSVLTDPVKVEVIDLAAEMILTSADGSLQLSVNGFPGETYVLQTSSSLESPYWVLLLTLTMNDSGQFTAFLPYDELRAAQFYRVVLQPADVVPE